MKVYLIVYQMHEIERGLPFFRGVMYEGGGIPQTPSADQVGGPGWYYVNINDRAAAWTDVNSLYDFLINGHFWDGGPEGVVKSNEILCMRETLFNIIGMGETCGTTA